MKQALKAVLKSNSWSKTFGISLEMYLWSSRFFIIVHLYYEKKVPDRCFPKNLAVCLERRFYITS